MSKIESPLKNVETRNERQKFVFRNAKSCNVLNTHKKKVLFFLPYMLEMEHLQADRYEQYFYYYLYGILATNRLNRERAVRALIFLPTKTFRFMIDLEEEEEEKIPLFAVFPSLCFHPWANSSYSSRVRTDDRPGCCCVRTYVRVCTILFQLAKFSSSSLFRRS